MLVVNFAHPLTDAQKARIAELAGRPVECVLDVRAHFNPQTPFAEQAQVLVELAGLSADEWQTTPLLVNPPSLSPIACLVLAELHGRMGHFPAVLRLRPVPDSTPPAFEVAEILQLQTIRDQARQRR